MFPCSGLSLATLAKWPSPLLYHHCCDAEPGTHVARLVGAVGREGDALLAVVSRQALAFDEGRSVPAAPPSTPEKDQSWTGGGFATLHSARPSPGRAGPGGGAGGRGGDGGDGFGAACGS